ncbi:MAG: tetratricopeptide repeat protein, partial [Deltaproteobacteria bacterium]|nr:tetratricopeptide repeat protein [Deltaproteobacteria bacterium]
MMPSQTPASPSLARFPALAALAAFIFLLALAPLPLAAEPSPPGGPPPYRPDWAFEGMSPELEALRAEAEALSDGSRHGEAAEAWRTLAAASESAYGAGDPRTLAALSRMARETEEDLSADPGGARDAARRAEAGLAAALGADSPETLFAYETAAWFALDAGEAQWANEAFTEIVGRAAESLGPYHPLALHSRYGLGAALLRAGNARAAAETLRETSEAAEKALPPGHQIALHARNGLALALSSLGETAAAADILRGALETCERTLGPEHPETLTYMNNLAHALNGLGDFASARDMHRKVLEASRRTLGPEHPDTLASINNLALALAGLGDYAAARGLHEEALEARRRILGPEHPDTLTSINNLAASQADLGDFAAARDMHREALEARRRTLSSEHPDTLISMNNLAHTLIRLGDYAAGRDLHREALESNKRTLGPEHPDTLISMNNLAYALASLGDFAAARDMLSRALESETRVLGPDHPSTAITAANLGTVHDRLGSPEEAAFYLKLSVRSAQKARAALSALEPELRRSWLATVEDRYRRLYDVLMRLGRAAEAMAVLDLLKKDELRGLDPEGAPEGAARDLFADTPEEAAWKRYSGAAEPLAALGLERVRLAEKRGREGLAAEEEARLAELDGLLETAAATFLDACEGLRDVLGGPEGEAAARAAEELRSRQETLAGMGEGTVLAHAVSAPDRLYLMLVTPHALVSLESPVGRDDLGRLAEEFRAALRNPAADPRPAGKKLYDAVFAPLEPELEAAGAKTVMLSLDGALRYVPMAALWDGERWLAEKYPTALYTLSTADKLRTPPPEGPASARALGVTAAWRGFPALPGVAAEIA